MRLLETDASQFDAELLDIYLTEADEVLDAIAASAVELKTRQDNRTALTTVRRGFHTLKGSGRMLQGGKNVEIDSAVPGDIAAVAKVDEIEFDCVLHDSHDEDHIHMAKARTMC